MANAVNIFNFAQTYATLLATSVSDGDYSDVLVTLKQDESGQVTPATQTNEFAGQLWSNATDDYIAATYQFHYRAPKWWSVADAAERDLLGSTVGLTVDDVAFQRDLNLFFAVVSVDGPAASTWIGSGGSLQAAYAVGNAIVTDAGNGAFGVTGTEAWTMDASAGTGVLTAASGLTIGSSAGNVAITSTLGQISAVADTSINLTATTGGITGTATAGAVQFIANSFASITSQTSIVTITAIEGAVVITSGAPVGGSASNASLIGGTPLSGNNNGGNAVCEGGDAVGSGTPGHVHLRTGTGAGVSEAEPVAVIDNRGAGTGAGSSAPVFVVESVPSFAADVGGFAFRNVGGAGTEGQVWHKRGAADAAWVQAENKLRFTTLKTGAYTALLGEHVAYDPSGGTFTLTMPASPVANDRVGFKNKSNSPTAVTIAGNGSDAEDPTAYILSSSVQLDGPGVSVVYQYDGTEWTLV